MCCWHRKKVKQKKVKQIDMFVGIQTVKVAFLIRGWKKDYLKMILRRLTTQLGGNVDFYLT